MVDRVRIKKYLQPKVDSWAKALGIPESKFVEEAINSYIRLLEGTQTGFLGTDVSTKQSTEQSVVGVDENIDDPEDFTGGIEL